MNSCNIKIPLTFYINFKYVYFFTFFQESVPSSTNKESIIKVLQNPHNFLHLIIHMYL